jgi:hypothetical protein
VDNGEEQSCFLVRDQNEQALAYVYFEDEPSLRVCKPMHHVKWDCFVWPANLDCGKASQLLRSSLDLERMPAAP